MVATVTFQPFNKINGVKAKDVPFYGGRTSLADYCPFWRVSRTSYLTDLTIVTLLV